MSIPRDLALEAIAPHVGDAIVVAVYQTCFDWMQICPRDLNFVSTGAMGQASSHGLGFALGRPDLRVIVFDGDGSLLMNLGALVTIAEAAPDNLHHFVFANGTYEVNGGHPVPGAKCTSFAGLAREAGYRSSRCYNDLDAFRVDAAGLLRAPGPCFTELRIVPGRAYPRDYDTIHGAETRARFRAVLSAAGPDPRNRRRLPP